uniref:Uncharacterized protein n=1 Tax=Rhizophora mucronata TaxID=61149 RepID=A0A2P2QAJ3_RHIMU
MSLKSLFP